MVIRKPADAARVPLGPTYTTTGVSALMMLVLMERVESTRPPGVRSVSTTSTASSASARAIVCSMNSADTGWMSASTTAE